MLPLRLHRAAQTDYDDAVDWYEAQQVGLGTRFIASIRQALLSIATHPRRWPEVLPGVREARVRRWPYCIYYQIHPDHVMILAVFHTSRDPAIWQGRVP